MDLNVKLDLAEIVNHKNVAELLDEETLTKIGAFVYDGWFVDLQSRMQWEVKMADALKLALQVKEEKTFPWVGSSNVKFPLVTIAAMQYHARAYPALIPGPDIVTCNIPKKAAQKDSASQDAQEDRIEAHMSYQLLEQDDCWEEQMDKALLIQAIVGCAFKKTYYDPVRKHNVSKLVLAQNLYLPYFASSMETASRITELIQLLPNELYEREARGLFLCPEIEIPPTYAGDNEFAVARQEAHGIIKPSQDSDPSVPYEFLEQHCWLDLDGDGYGEPYIVTIRKDTRDVRRIVARFFTDSIIKDNNGTILSILPDHHYTKYPFVPSPDGGIYDIGFGAILAPLNASIDTIINQLLDAGTLSNTAGGFLGRGVKMRAGDNQFRPFEWKRVDSTGDDLQKGIFPLPVREPSPVLFQLLDLLINYGERIGMATDPMTGENVGQNTKKGTMDAMIQEGQKVFNSIFKRTYRALKSELRKLFRLNQYFFYPEEEDALTGYSGEIYREDYMISDKCIQPTADPFMTGDNEKKQQALALKQFAMQTPGYNRYEVEKRVLKALKISDVDTIFPDPKGPNAVPPPVNPKLQIEQLKAQIKEKEIQLKLQLAQMELMAEAEVNRAKIAELEAKATKELAEANGVSDGHKIAMLELLAAAKKQHTDGITKVMEILQKELQGDREHEQFKIEQRTQNTGNAGGMGQLEAASSNSQA